MYDFLEDYGQFLLMLIIFLIGGGVYAGYLYYQKQEDMKKVNNNLQNVNNVQKPHPPDFISSDTFKGEQKGYVFKNGDKGTGYYKEK